MKNYLKPISISLSPNTEKDDIRLAFRLLFKPKTWKRGKAILKLEESFKKYFNVKYAFSFNSGRSAFLAILNSLDFKKGDEILLQAFCCNAVVNPIIWSGLKPIFVDCDEKTFNIDIDDLKRKISKRSRAVVVQHTFGQSANIQEIAQICNSHNLIMVEDCAHALGAKYHGYKLGILGQAAFFSFGRDKVISSVYGGVAICHDSKIAEKIKNYQEKISYPNNYWTFQQLLHPILMNKLILPTYRILGKYLLVFFQQLNILSKAVHKKEKTGKKPMYFPAKMPNALALLALKQLEKLERFNSHRLEIAKIYYEKLDKKKFILAPILAENIYLRYTVKSENAHLIIKRAWKENLLIGDWYASPIAPRGTDFKKVGYEAGTCPKAEKLAKNVFNLPTHINIDQKEAERIIQFLNHV